MGAGKRIVAFGGGGMIGFVVGSLVSTLTASQSGADLRQQLIERAKEIKAVGDQAQAAVEAELISRFRADVDDPNALAPEAERVTLLRSRALTAVGLGLGAQGAYAAEDLRDRALEAERQQRDLSLPDVSDGGRQAE